MQRERGLKRGREGVTREEKKGERDRKREKSYAAREGG
jgi:hypothetical protein